MEASLRRVLTQSRNRLLGLAPALTAAFLLGPILAGVLGTLLPAFGFWPAIGARNLSLSAWRDLFSTPGLLQAALVSVAVGIVTTLSSFAVVVTLTAAFHGTAWATLTQRFVPAFLALPHLALAIGFAFLFAPSGWLLRLFADALAISRPPDVLVINDPMGLSMIAGLIVKEIPFLVFVVTATLPQIDVARTLAVAQSLGYGRFAIWLKVVLPQLYPRLRLPLLAVLSYAASVVDVAIILGPTKPPTLAVQVLRWTNDPDSQLRLRASAGALAELGVATAAILLWLIGERLVALMGNRWVARGRRLTLRRIDRIGAICLAVLEGSVAGAALLVLFLWSIADRWWFPNPLPDAFTTTAWANAIVSSGAALSRTIAVAIAVSLVALTLTVGCLENERDHPAARAATPLLYVPLMLPQIAFLGGIQWLLLALRLDIDWLSVGLAHLVFVLPYVFFALADPWRAYDPRFRTIARCLGASPWRVFWAVQLPMLVRPVAAAAAIGVAVSVSQYLPTVLCSSGRFETITTLALTLSSGGDRRLAAVYALLQTAIPLVAFMMAIGLPTMLARRLKVPTNAK
jgi:putative thiamine transport system permease protein